MADRKEAIKQAREAFRDAGYELISHHILRDEDGKKKTGDLWMYSDGAEVCMIRGYWEGTEYIGWDVFVPIVDSNKVEDTLAAIRARGPAPD